MKISFFLHTAQHLELGSLPYPKVLADFEVKANPFDGVRLLLKAIDLEL